MTRTLSFSPFVLLTALAALSGAAMAAEADAPRLPGDVPNLNGNWDNGGGIPFLNPTRDGENVCLFGCKGGERVAEASPGVETYSKPDRPTYKAAYQDKQKDLEARQVEEDPILRCEPPGVPRIGPPDKIVQTPTEVVFLYEDVSGPFYRVVPLGRKSHPHTDMEPAYLGYSTGWWEGDELVVETTNQRADTWLADDGSFHTADLRVVERIRRDGDTLYWNATAYDPVLDGPWHLREREARLTDVALAESPPCREQDLQHMQDMTYHDNSR